MNPTFIPRQIVISLPEGQDEVNFPCHDGGEWGGIEIQVKSVRVGESKVLTDVAGRTFRYTVIRKLKA